MLFVDFSLLIFDRRKIDAKFNNCLIRKRNVSGIITNLIIKVCSIFTRLTTTTLFYLKFFFSIKFFIRNIPEGFAKC